MKLSQSAASADRPASGAPDGAGSRVVIMKVFSGPKSGAKQVRVVAPTSVSSAPKSGNIKKCVQQKIIISHTFIVIILILINGSYLCDGFMYHQYFICR